MVNEIKTIYPYGLNEGFGSKFWVDYWVWQETAEKEQRMLWLKHEYKDEDTSLNTLTNKSYQTSFTLSQDILIKIADKDASIIFIFL